MPPGKALKQKTKITTLTKVKMINLSKAPKLGAAAVLHNATNLSILWDANANSVTFHIHVIANVDPGTNNDNPHAPVVSLPQNFSLFFYNGQGQWSTSPSPPPLYGPDGDGKGLKQSPPYLANAQNGQLVGVTGPESNGGYIVVPYTTANGWRNTTGRDLSLRFFINDVVGSYADNVGSVDCDVVISP
jgi:hypothetical protein